MNFGFYVNDSGEIDDINDAFDEDEDNINLNESEIDDVNDAVDEDEDNITLNDDYIINDIGEDDVVAEGDDGDQWGVRDDYIWHFIKGECFCMLLFL